jgi:hypothetical protein
MIGAVQSGSLGCATVPPGRTERPSPGQGWPTRASRPCDPAEATSRSRPLQSPKSPYPAASFLVAQTVEGRELGDSAEAVLFSFYFLVLQNYRSVELGDSEAVTFSGFVFLSLRIIDPESSGTQHTGSGLPHTTGPHSHPAASAAGLHTPTPHTTHPPGHHAPPWPPSASTLRPATTSTCPPPPLGSPPTHTPDPTGRRRPDRGGTHAPDFAPPTDGHSRPNTPHRASPPKQPEGPTSRTGMEHPPLPQAQPPPSRHPQPPRTGPNSTGPHTSTPRAAGVARAAGEDDNRDGNGICPRCRPRRQDTDPPTDPHTTTPPMPLPPPTTTNTFS